MRLAVIGSGSSGNALVVESAGARLLVDAGFSCGRIERALRELGSEAKFLDALLLTHEHTDHVKGADRLARRAGMPIYGTRGTLQGTALGDQARALTRVIRSGEPFEVMRRAVDAGGRGAGRPAFRVEPFRLPHDAREPVGFLIEDAAGHRLGVLSDLGCRSRLAWGRLNDLDALVIESNHDLQLLRNGPYPWHLKERVASRRGHLSNAEAALGVEELLCDRLQAVVLYHLSRTNNRPEMATEAVGEMLAKCGSKARVELTRQDAVLPWIELRRETAGRGDPCPARGDVAQLSLSFG